MRFVKGLWKVLVGIKDALVLLLLLLFFGGLYAALSATPHAGGPTNGALVLRIDGPIVEQPAEVDPWLALAGQNLPREYRVADLVHALDTAAADARIEAVVLDLDLFAGGRQVALGDVADAIDRARAGGKRVLAYATGYDDDTYQLASHADEVWLSPMGAVLLTGPGGTNLYYAELLERLGITANVYRVGAFKSAVEPFTRSDMSPEARQASQALADALWEQWRQDVRRARPRAQVDPYVADPTGAVMRHNGDLAHTAREMGLVDRIGDRATFNARVAELVGRGHEAVPNSYRAVQYRSFLERNPLERQGNVGILTIAGEISDGETGTGQAGAATIVRTLEQGMRDHDLRALVVRIDSPGGSATGSERIRQALLNVKRRGIPVVVSFGSVAASGGYWIGAAGDRIFAEPSTITGSIGVFGVLPSFEGTLRNIGVGVDGVRTTPLSGEPDLLRGPSDEADRLLQLGVEGMYRRFLTLVSQARNLPVQRVHEIGQGRVWDGGTARQLGLVDQFGSLQDAVNEVARRANLEADQVRAVHFAPQTDWFDRYFGRLAQSFAAAPAASEPDPFARLRARPEALIARALGDAQSLLRGPAIQARCLDCPSSYETVPSGAAASLWRGLVERAAAR
ncbi:signal peptide peptidase SppA [Sphingosinicella sp. YJ22]|uniref:signal peptide peptidase SppA n=1 Tax=Sphingosinicella sp. YJ22 TaxID=1104780 RepID=UPI0014089D16|nr:signal peptide peptidase SppA [Sphingosinicella sp. YJ22]